MVKRARKMFRLLVVGVLVTLLTLSGCGAKASITQADKGNSANTDSKKAATAEPEYASFKDKTVTFIVATGPGGGYDTYGRLIASYLQKYLPGSTVIVKNVPGAGHVIGANEIYNSKPDGLTLGIFDKALMITQMTGQSGVKFDLNKMTWIGNAASEPRAFIVGTQTLYKTPDDLKKAAEIKLGGTGIGSANTNDSELIKNILGLPIKVINGYSGQQGDLAIIKGELDGQIGAYSSMKKMVDNKTGRIIFTIGKEKIENYPILREIAPPDKKALVDFMEAQAQLSRVIAGPPGLPDGIMTALREALKKALQDEELITKAKQAKLPINYMGGDDVAKMVSAAMNQSPDIIQLLKQITATK